MVVRWTVYSGTQYYVQRYNIYHTSNATKKKNFENVEKIVISVEKRRFSVWFLRKNDRHYRLFCIINAETRGLFNRKDFENVKKMRSLHALKKFSTFRNLLIYNIDVEM